MSRLFRLAAAAALALVCLLQLLALALAPQAWLASRIEVRLRPGESIVLGRHELAAPQADAAHLLLRRDSEGRWYAQNASVAKQLLVEREGKARHAGSLVLAAGQELRVGASGFAVTFPAAGVVELRSADSTWRYDGAALTRDGKAQPACAGAGMRARLPMPRPLSFGGNLHCGNRIGIAGVAAGDAAITRAEDGFVLAARPALPLLVRDRGHAYLLGRQDQALDGATALTIGHTRLLAAIDGERLRLRPSGHVALRPSARADLPPQVTWELQRRSLWHVPGTRAAQLAAVAVALLLAGGAAVAAVRRRQALACIGWSALLALGGLALLAMQRSGSAPGAGIAVVLGACALWHLLLGAGRIRAVTAAAAILLGIGLLAQLELGLGSGDSATLRHVTRSAALAALGLGLLPLLRQCAPRGPLRQTVAEWLLLSCAAVALALLLAQAAIGNETGVFDMQPVELAKLVLAALTAHCLALAASPGAAGPASLPAWLRLLAPVALFVALLAVALVQVDDYSPLVLLLVWSAVMAFAWALASNSKRLATAIATLACTAGLGIGAIQQDAPGRVQAPQFYGDRFQVWLDPETHPHTGQQVLRAAAAIGAGGTWGADRALGLATLGKPAPEALRIPAVQDDFAPAFFLHRHGVAGAIALWLLQALFLAGLAQLALRAWAAAGDARDFRSAWLERLRCFTLAGGAGFVAGHLLLSWGTNLGLLPVMGQPMSFLSAGGSHLLLFICPLLVLATTSAESLEENESCRSTSNMKPLAR